MTFKEQYKKAMHQVVPSEDFSTRLKTALVKSGLDENVEIEKKDSFIKNTENVHKPRRIWTGILTAACLCIATGIAVFWMKSADVSLTANGAKSAEAVVSESAVVLEQEVEEVETTERVETGAEDVAEEVASKEGNMDGQEFMISSEVNPTTGGSSTDGTILYDFVEPLAVESISIEINVEEPLGDGGWLALCVSQQEVEEFAETLYHSYAYSMVEEIEGGQSEMYGDGEQFYELNLMLADGSSLRLTVSEDGLVVVEDLKLIVYMECGNEAFLNVWNACENAW